MPPTVVFHSQTERIPPSVKLDSSKNLDSKPAGPITKSELSDKIKRAEKLRATSHSSTPRSSEPEVIEIDGDENANNDGNVKILEDAEMEDGDSSLLGSTSLSPPKATHLQPSSVEEVDDRASSTGAQTSRLANKHRPAPLAARSGNSSNGLIPPATAFKSTSPVIPSPLRHVSLPPDDDDDEASDATPERQQASSTIDTTMKDTKDAASPSLSPKLQALRIPLQELTVFQVLLPTSIAAIQTLCKSRKPLEALEKATALPEADLPKYDFTFASDSKPICADSTLPIIKTTSASPSPAPFDFAAAGFKLPPTPTGTWTCSVCACQSPFRTIKCTVCDSPKPMDSPSSASPSLPIQVKSEDSRLTNGAANVSRGAAAGIATVSSDVWTCSTCEVQNALDKQKCIACEAPRSRSSQPVSPKTPVASFDWTAAGMAKPVVPPDVWTCSICEVQNALDKQKCMACEAPRPGSSHPVSPKTPVAGFEWAAAGLKPKDIRNT